MAARGPARRAKTQAELVLDTGESSLLDLVDNVLAKGVVLTGDVTLALADVELIYLRLSVLLCAADRILPDAGSAAARRRRAIHRTAARPMRT